MGQEFSSATGELQEGASKIRSGFDEAVGKAKDTAGRVKEAAQEKMRRAGETASEYYKQGLDKARSWEGDLESFIKERPITSILIAAGFGILCGVYMNRRR